MKVTFPDGFYPFGIKVTKWMDPSSKYGKTEFHSIAKINFN